MCLAILQTLGSAGSAEDPDRVFRDIHDVADQLESIARSIREDAYRRNSAWLRIHRAEFVLSKKVGEPIAVSGEFSAELWTPEGGGEPRLSWKITADAVLSAKAKPKQRTGREVADTSWAAP